MREDGKLEWGKGEGGRERLHPNSILERERRLNFLLFLFFTVCRGRALIFADAAFIRSGAAAERYFPRISLAIAEIELELQDESSPRI